MRRTEAIPHLLAVVQGRNTWTARCAAAGSLRQLGWNPNTAGRWLSSTPGQLAIDAGRSTSRVLDEATELFQSTKSERDADQAMEKIVEFLESSPASAAEATLQKIAAFPVARTFESFVQAPPDDATKRLLGEDAEQHTFGRTERSTVNACLGAVLAAMELARRRQGLSDSN